MVHFFFFKNIFALIGPPPPPLPVGQVRAEGFDIPGNDVRDERKTEYDEKGMMWKMGLGMEALTADDDIYELG